MAYRKAGIARRTGVDYKSEDVPSEQEPVFPCPLCHQPAGRHDRFAVREGGMVRIIVRCDACRHRWTVILPASEAGGPNTTE